jgi:hypothetical protein
MCVVVLAITQRAQSIAAVTMAADLVGKNTRALQALLERLDEPGVSLNTDDDAFPVCETE